MRLAAAAVAVALLGALLWPAGAAHAQPERRRELILGFGIGGGTTTAVTTTDPDPLDPIDLDGPHGVFHLELAVWWRNGPLALGALADTQIFDDHHLALAAGWAVDAGERATLLFAAEGGLHRTSFGVGGDDIFGTVDFLLLYAGARAEAMAWLGAGRRWFAGAAAIGRYDLTHDTGESEGGSRDVGGYEVTGLALMGRRY